MNRLRQRFDRVRVRFSRSKVGRLSERYGRPQPLGLELDRQRPPYSQLLLLIGFEGEVGCFWMGRAGAVGVVAPGTAALIAAGGDGAGCCRLTCAASACRLATISRFN